MDRWWLRLSKRLLNAYGATYYGVLALAVAALVTWALTSRQATPTPSPAHLDPPPRHRDPRAKTILTWNDLFGARHFGAELGNASFRTCRVSNCELWDRLDAETDLPHDEYDAIVFHGIETGGGSSTSPLPLRRRPQQRYVFVLQESPAMRPHVHDLKHFFNWSATYRRDSDIVISLVAIRSKDASGVHYRDTNNNNHAKFQDTSDITDFISAKSRETTNVHNCYNNNNNNNNNRYNSHGCTTPTFQDVNPLPEFTSVNDKETSSVQNNDNNNNNKDQYDAHGWRTPTFHRMDHLPSFVAKKTKPVVWFVSNSDTQSKRDIYVDELSRHIAVDVYGAGRRLSCGRDAADDCDAMLDTTYKFYLAFENSLCEDYVTEKFTRATVRYVVPVVYGGADYRSYAPQHSYIDVRDYGSPAELARYLHYLDNNPLEYDKYFWWKAYYQQNGGNMWCDLCEKLNDPAEPNKVYPDIDKWWKYDGVCNKPEDYFAESFYRSLYRVDTYAEPWWREHGVSASP